MPHHWKGVPGRHVLLEHLKEYGWSQGAWKFCFVRNPVDAYVSWWRWLVSRKAFRNKRHDSIQRLFRFFHWHPMLPLITCLRGEHDFNAWATEVLKCWPRGYLSDLYEQYCGTEECPKVDWIGRCETLNADLKFLFPQVDAIPTANLAKWPMPEVDPLIRESIAKVEHRILERFYGEKMCHRNVKEWQ
jgi:hypothetical protein